MNLRDESKRKAIYWPNLPSLTVKRPPKRPMEAKQANGSKKGPQKPLFQPLKDKLLSRHHSIDPQKPQTKLPRTQSCWLCDQRYCLLFLGFSMWFLCTAGSRLEYCMNRMYVQIVDVPKSLAARKSSRCLCTHIWHIRSSFQQQKSTHCNEHP